MERGLVSVENGSNDVHRFNRKMKIRTRRWSGKRNRLFFFFSKSI